MWQRIRRIIQYTGPIVVSILLCNGIIYNPLTAADKSDISEPTAKAAIAENYGRLPLSFEVNNGQADDVVKFLSRGNGYTLYLTPEEAVLSLRRASVSTGEMNVLMKDPQKDEPEQMEREVVHLRNIGTNPDPRITGLEELPGKSNYFIGNDPDKWHTDVSNYERVKIENIYPGIDLVYYGNQRQIEYDWIVAPGADPNAIRFAVESNVDSRIDAQGNLILDETGELRLNKPLIYQERDGGRTQIAGRYVVRDNRQVGIRVDKYDAALPLVIDPVLSYSTYLGGNHGEMGRGIAVDSSGNAYVTGETYSADFPEAKRPQSIGLSYGAVFVSKINAAGDALVYSTYFGGNRYEVGRGITVDSSGNAYVTGETSSTDFPTQNPFRASNNGYYDAFVTKLNAEGNALVYSTYLGGSFIDCAREIAVDAFGNAHITGFTESADFPMENPLQMSHGGKTDVFVAKLNAQGNALIYSTYLGGFEVDYGLGIAVDSSANAFVTGETVSENFPISNPLQANHSGYYDVFVTKLNASGNSLVYSTYLGGSDGDFGRGIAVDSIGNAYVTGNTGSIDFPSENPFQATLNNSENSWTGDVFVTKLNASGNSLVYSTYLGGNYSEQGYGIDVDSSGNAYVTGSTESADFPTKYPFQATLNNSENNWTGDVFVTKLNASGNSLVYSTYLGGTGGDSGHGIAVDSIGNAYVTGSTRSIDFPTENPFQASYGGERLGGDAFVTKIGAVSELFFPEITVGGGWTTAFEIFNTGSTATSGNLILTDQQGNGLTVSSSELGTGSSFPFSILPGGSIFLTFSSLNPSDPAAHGWALLEFWGGSLSGVASYQFEAEGTVTALAGVLPSQPMQFATLPVDDKVDQTQITAYAIANPTDQILLVKLCLVDADGNVVDDTVSFQLYPGEQIARYFFQDFGFSEFKGAAVLRAQGNGSFVAVALNQNQELFTVTPVEGGKAPDIPD